MRRSLCLLALAAALLLHLAGAALAQPAKPPAGRFSVDPESCKSGDIFLTLMTATLTTPVFRCQGLSFTEVRSPAGQPLWLVDGARCEGKHAGSPGPKRFHIETRGETLRLHWPDSTRPSTFLRCGK